MKALNYKKRNLICFGIVLLFFLLMLSTFYLTYKKHRDTVVKQQEQQLGAIAAIGADYFNTYVREKNLEIQNMFTFQKLGTTLSEAEFKVESIIKQYLNQSPTYLDLMRFYSIDEIKELTLFGLSDRELAALCEKALKSNELITGPAAIINQNNVGLYFIKGIFNEYGKYGFLIGRINIANVFLNTLSFISPGNNGFFTISDVDGTAYALKGTEKRFSFAHEILLPSNNKKLLSGYSLASIGRQTFLITASLPYDEIKQPVLITFYLLLSISIGLFLLSLLFAFVMLRLQKRKMSYEMERKLTAQINESNRTEVIGLFSRKIAHEYNNFLTPISIYCELLEEELKDQPDAFSYVAEIKDSVSSCTQLAKDLLAFGRNQTTNHEMILFNSSKCIRDTIDKLRLVIPSIVTLESEITEEELFLKGQPLELVQVLYNLVTNSVHALEMRHAPKISVSYQREGKESILTIKDNGCGIPSSVQKKILSTKFTTKTEGKGNGLGLMIVAGIVEKYDGRISFTSIPEKGTEFTLHFPCISDKTVTNYSRDIQISALQ